MRSDGAGSGGQGGSARETLAETDRARFADLLVLVATRQDRTAYAELFGYYAPRVKSYLMRLGADNAQAEEITQDVMVTVWRKAQLFDRAQASVSTWIFRIARNRRIDVFRRTKKPGLDPEEPMILPAAAEAPDARIEIMETETRIRAAMKDLPEEQLHLLRLAFYEGLSHREIADKLDLPLGTVKSRIRLAFGKMKARLEND
ncbi:MAG TPA: sigma-70 family RNA polymerase sigma factor [Hyphomonadaceae bacterium]|jgi:RNA polymerase sigma-70 factor (ECF subfamily)|nr:sigma-70 family RNA polymerase sigma factor [Hyphomonadaceae bacterium]